MREFKLINLHAYVFGRNQLFGRDPLVIGINTLGGSWAMGSVRGRTMERVNVALWIGGNTTDGP
jgi:hypothetical protein